jgi:hypothetical protein
LVRQAGGGGQRFAWRFGCVRGEHLRQSPALPQPEAYLGGVDKLFDASGQLANASTRQFCELFLKAFEAWVRRQL